MLHSINRRLLEDRSLWQEINQQTALFLELFTEISNQYPQKQLLIKFPQSRGSKVTKGLQLHGFPYQVLDMVRDFDQEIGFNLRILNWWGNGLFLIILGGKSYTTQLRKAYTDKLLDYWISNHPEIWEYEKILWTPKEKNQKIHIEKPNSRVQLFKKIELLESLQETKTVLIKEIDRIMEYPW